MEIIRVCGFLALVVSAFGMNCPPILSKVYTKPNFKLHLEFMLVILISSKAQIHSYYAGRPM